MSPFIARVIVGDQVGIAIQVLAGAPLPNPLAGGVNFDDNISPHALRDLFAVRTISFMLLYGLVTLRHARSRVARWSGNRRLSVGRSATSPAS